MKLAKKILKIALEARKKKYDVVFVITGRERVGKSNLLLHCLEVLGVKSLKGVCTLDGPEFFNIVNNAGYDHIVACDEAGDILFSRDAMTKETKKIVKLFKICGHKRIITFLVLPQFKFIDRYFREHRVDGLFNVFERKRFNFFDRHLIETEIYRFNRIPIMPKKSDYYSKYKGKLLKEYDKMKDDFVFKDRSMKIDLGKV